MFRKSLLVLVAAAIALSGCSNSTGETDTGAAKATLTDAPSNAVQGTGSKTVAVTRPDGNEGNVLVHIKAGTDRLSVLHVTGNHEPQALVESVGMFDGVVILTNPKTTELAITTTEDWSVEFLPVTAAIPFDGKNKMAGTGPAVLANQAGKKVVDVKFSTTDRVFAGQRSFRIWDLGATDPTTPIFDKIGRRGTGEMTVTDDGLIVVSDPGNWELTARS